MHIIQRYQSPNFNNRPDSSELNAIILHFTEYDFARTIEKFLTVQQVSAHYVIDKDGTIYQCVADELRAWHAGISYWRGQHNLNDTSLGIELVNDGQEPYPTLQLQALLALLQFLLKKHPSIKPQAILGHSDIAPNRKVDPGAHFPWRLLAEHHLGHWPTVDNFIDADTTILQLGDSNAQVTKMQTLLTQYGYRIDLTQQFDNQTAAVVYAFRSHFMADSSMITWDINCTALLKNLLQYNY